MCIKKAPTRWAKGPNRQIRILFFVRAHYPVKVVLRQDLRPHAQIFRLQPPRDFRHLVRVKCVARYHLVSTASFALLVVWVVVSYY